MDTIAENVFTHSSWLYLAEAMPMLCPKGKDRESCSLQCVAQVLRDLSLCTLFIVLLHS